MKKITLLMTLLLLWSFNSNAQLSEDFEGATFPPTGWVDFPGDPADGLDVGNLWAISTVTANSGTQSAYYDDFATGEDNNRWLISPPLDLSGGTDLELTYFENIDFASFADENNVYYSTDYDGTEAGVLTATWIELNSTIGAEDVWTQAGPFDLPEVAGVYIAFNYIGTFASGWFIDDVSVAEGLGCDNPIATFTVETNCPADDGFSIDVDITSIGAASGVTISDDQGTTPVTGLMAGLTSFGAYANGTDVVITVTNDDNVLCLLTSPTLTFSGVCPPPAPDNDDFIDAAPIFCGDNVVGSTEFATLDEDDAEDGFGADMDSRNVWFNYDSSIDGPQEVTVDLCPSGYDTSFLVYRNGTPGNLGSPVAGNDDSAICGNTRSYGSFITDGVSTYNIGITGFSSFSFGAFDLTITCGPACTPTQTNQDCASATALGVDGSTATEDNTCATLSASTTSCELFESIADLWYTFEAPVSGEVNIVTALGTATAAHLAVYEGSCGSLNEIACSTAETASASLTSLTGGTTYYLQVWNNGSEEGTIDITLSDASLSVGSFDNDNAFTYFPNPVKNELTLKAQNTIQNISVLNMLGQEVLRATPNALESNLNMNDLSQGAYFVQVTINNVTEVVRILKQ